MQLSVAFGVWSYADTAPGAREALINSTDHNTHAIGMILYDKYFILFQLAGLILLVSMIGAIVLTLRHRKNVKRQDILAQIYRDPNDALEVVDIKPGQGL
jgi:NADH-quinone oxidoreductase subunit J